MASPEEEPNVVPYEPGPGPSLVHSPSGSESTASHVSFDPDSLPPDEQCLDYTPFFPGDWRQEDEEGLLALGWTGKPMHEYAYWQSYCPFWTSPTWDPTIETTIDGSMQKAVRGSGEVVMRPTILPRDEGVRRTEYTKRWGINEAFPKTSNDEARSGLTPTAPADPESERLWTQEESWQTYWFDGFTAQELIDIGAYAPDTDVPMSDLPASALNPWNNDDLWIALQPSLRLASNVINSRHPMWLMFLRGIYHMRKVPREKDGRTDREKIQDQYRQYRTLYPEIDEAEILLATLRLSQPRTSTIRILLNVHTVWPLLVDEYPESEKVGIRCKLATTILHELSHACHQAHYQMLEQPRRFLSDMQGINFTDDLEFTLNELRFEAIGPGSRAENGRQYFIENDIQMEEGKAFDVRIWGALPDYFPPTTEPSTFKPIFSTRNWPYPHPEIYHQNIEAVRAGRYNNFSKLPYKAYLLFPRAPVYDLYTPLPVSNYAHLLQSSWWDADFQKFGHEALKISSTRADQSYPLQSTLAFRYNDFKSLLAPLVGNRQVIRFLFVTAPGILLNQGQNLILAWLSKVSFDIAGAKILRLRLHYERNTWDDKYGAIRDLCQRLVLNLTTASGDLQVHLDSGDPQADWRQVDAQLDALLRHTLLELHRLVDYEGRYGQCVAAEYFLKDLDDRWLVRRSMHVLLGHLQSSHDQVGAVTTGMIELWQRMAAAGARFTGQVQECESLYGRLTTAQTAIQGVVQVLQGNTLDERSGAGGHGPLAAVPASRREFKNGRSLRIAAMKEFARVTDPKVKRCIRTWLNIIQFSQDIRHDDPDAVDVVVGGGTIAELKRATDQATADALAISYLDRQDQVEANRAKGMEPAEGEDRVIDELQQEMAQLQTSSGIPDLFSQSFSEEEQNRLRRRRTI
ncbi:hypothetical protein LA080_000149 [Diaporthe eres]|nr:hypothetical protein LA080_000149 [Diaporthe eres]